MGTITGVVVLVGSVAMAGVLVSWRGLLLGTSRLLTVGRMSEGDELLTAGRLLKPAVLPTDGGVLAIIVLSIAEDIVLSIASVFVSSIPLVPSIPLVSSTFVRVFKAIV